jgi:hypothetical protein
MSEIPESILIWPSVHRGVVSSGFDLMTMNLHSVAPLTGDIVPGGTVDQRFVTTLEFPPKQALAGREQVGLLARLRGMRGRIRLGDSHRRIPAYNLRVLATEQGFSDGTFWSDATGWLEGFLPPFVSVSESARRGDRSMVIGGLPVSTAHVFAPGDLFEVRPNGQFCSHAHCYLVTHYSNSDENGETRVEFEPGLRAGVKPGDQVVLRDPTSVFQLISDGEGRSTRDAAHHWRMGMSLVEVPIPLPGVEFGQ